MKSWLNNPRYLHLAPLAYYTIRFFLGIKQHVEVAVVLVQNPAEAIPENLNNLLDIGLYITNSDGDGSPKTNEAKVLSKLPPTLICLGFNRQGQFFPW